MKPEYFNEDELEKMAPGLSKIKKENPFLVPENYFDSLADTIQQKINALPDFEGISKENPFHVPEGYFDSLPTIIQQRIIDEKKSVFREWIGVVFRPRLALAVASILLLLIFGIKYISKSPHKDLQDNYFSCEEFKSSSYIADVDESTLVDVLEQENKGTSLQEDNSMEQYLIDNNIDISQLENHL